MDPSDRTSQPWPKLPVGVCLAIKKLREPELFDVDRLTTLNKKPLPDLEEIPRIYLILYAKRVAADGGFRL